MYLICIMSTTPSFTVGELVLIRVIRECHHRALLHLSLRTGRADSVAYDVPPAFCS